MKRMVISALALVGIFVALYLTLYKVGAIGQLACSIGGCERVNTSRWATFLGLPVAMWGIGFYVVTFGLAFLGTLPRYVASRGISLILIIVSAIGFVFSAWLTSLELFVIHSICEYCVTSAIIVTLIFIMSIADLQGRKQLQS